MKARSLSQIAEKVKDSKFGRILLFTGARQTGKTTLVRNLLKDYKYLSVEDPMMRGAYERLTAAQWRMLYPKAVIDEVQKVPSIIESIKAVYDESEMPRYALLGSSQILLLGKVRETLAGRCTILELFPLTLPELRTDGFEQTVESSFLQKIVSGEMTPEQLPPSFVLDPEMAEKQAAYEHYLKYGGYPAVSDESLTESERWDWLGNYARTYLERDLADLATLRELEPFTKLRMAAALETGTMLNAESLARQIGITGKTVKRYLQYLSISYQSILLEPWSRNAMRRLMKAPKFHFLDPGVLRTILGKRSGLSGAEFESAVVSEIYKQLHLLQVPTHCYHLRTLDGFEIDLLVEVENGYYAFEMKIADRVTSPDARHLKKLASYLDKPLLHSFVVSNDPETKLLADNVSAIHAALLLG